jgi:hypothetical protein
MKKTSLICVGIILTFTCLLAFADIQFRPILPPVLRQSVNEQTVSAEDMGTLLAVIEQMPLVSAESVPRGGNFYSAAHLGFWPPLPNNLGYSAWQINSNTFILDDLEAEAERYARQAAGLLPPGFEEGNGTNGYQPGSFTPRVFTTNDLWLQLAGTTNSAVCLVIHHPWNVTNEVYDLFETTNLSPVAWQWVLRSAAGQTNLTVTNLTAPMDYFILGLTNDTDGGGFSDCYERLVLGTDPSNPNDDILIPLASIKVTDSVAVEQESTNTAKFVISRLGGYIGQPLTIGCQISGTATYATDYTLSSVTATPTNLLVTIPAGQTNIQITLSAINDTNVEGSETVTLTLMTNSAWEVDAVQGSATAWILEQYTHVYTLNQDFNLGVMAGLEAANDRLQFKTNLPPQFPFINVACSDRGTVARINTTNGIVIGEYLTAPTNIANPSPSRTTVDQYGNVWVANRKDTLLINGIYFGSITRIGLIVGGTRYSKTNGVFVPDPQGQYVSLSNATYNTCIDRDGDGFIRTSHGMADILPWGNGFGVDSEGGVSSAKDEAITEYTRVACTGTRTIAVDKFNDIWVGGHDEPQIHLKVNGLTGLPVPNSAFDAYAGGYGGVIDALGNLWSSGSTDERVVWLKPPAVLPPTNDDWKVLLSAPSGYGIAVDLDPLYPRIWQTYNGYVFRWNTNGTPGTNVSGSVILYPHGYGISKGLVVATNGHVWVGHAEYSTSVGHLDTNGVWVGNVDLRVNGLLAAYFANTNLSGAPVLVKMEGPVDYSWTNGWPGSPMPTNNFSARWSGRFEPQSSGNHTFYVSANAGAAFRLILDGETVIDNWDNPATNAVESSGTSGWLAVGTDYGLRLEYRETTGAARIKLAWTEPGSTNKAVIPLERLVQLGEGPNGVSVDEDGKIWVACWNSDSAMRIDPNAGNVVVTNGVTNHVGAVDLAVDLGDGSEHEAPYNVAAAPYNYSDMTGFNNRVVNPAMKPLKGYWTVIDDCGIIGEVWNRISWNATLTNDCSVEVFVRATDDRQALANELFVPATNNVTLTGVKGRFIELRLAMIRDDANQQPLLNDLTLHGTSSGFNSDAFLDDTWAYETQDAVFSSDFTAPGPMSYQWFVQYPWTNQWTLVPGATNSSLVMSNVDSFVDLTWASVLVTDVTGESLWLGPAELWVVPSTIIIPGSSSSGPASRYPATINVFGQPTNMANVTVKLWSLSHGHSADVDILLVSPSDKKIMLMSDVGGTNGVSHANLFFHEGWSSPPVIYPIPSGDSYYKPSNYGQITQLTNAPAGPYSIHLDDLAGDDPNGVWKLYIYDDHQGGIGQLQDSWQLDFTFQ